MITDNLKKTVEDYFKIQEETSEQIYKQLQLLVFQNETKENDLYYLVKLIGPENTDKIIDYFGGGNLRIPAKKQYRESLLVALVFYLKDILGKDWKEIKEILDIDDKKTISGVSITKKIASLRHDIKQKMKELIQKLNPEDIKSIVGDLDCE